MSTNTNVKKSVVQAWLAEGLTWKQQTVVLSALRGCDGMAKDDPCKVMHKYLRSVVLENAGTKATGYMNTSIEEYKITEVFDERFKLAQTFRRDIDKYPTHYILHFMHAAEIIGYNHPDGDVRRFWFNVYKLFCGAMHLNVESREQNDERLRDGVDSD